MLIGKGLRSESDLPCLPMRLPILCRAYHPTHSLRQKRCAHSACILRCSLPVLSALRAPIDGPAYFTLDPARASPLLGVNWNLRPAATMELAAYQPILVKSSRPTVPNYGGFEQQKLIWASTARRSTRIRTIALIQIALGMASSLNYLW